MTPTLPQTELAILTEYNGSVCERGRELKVTMVEQEILARLQLPSRAGIRHESDADFVVCLVGFPGVGKLPIARAPSLMTGATMVDNHWINDPIIKLVAKDGLHGAAMAQIAGEFSWSYASQAADLGLVSRWFSAYAQRRLKSELQR